MEVVLYPEEVSERGAFYEALMFGAHLFWVATHAYQDDSGKWLPKTVPGTYTCVRGKHTIPNGRQFYTFEVTGVEGHSGILFVHTGNRPQVDSEGCYLCGRGLGFLDGSRCVIASQDAYDNIFTPKFKGVESFQLTVKDLP